MDRRSFLGWAGMGCVASSLPGVLVGCSNSTDTVESGISSPGSPAAVTTPDGFQNVGTVTELEQGPIVVTQGLPSPVMVVRDSAASNGVVAVNPTCTHAGCQVKWQSQEKRFACPCHGSQFQANGTVVQGPAREPLQQYEVMIEGDQVMVKQS